MTYQKNEKRVMRYTFSIKLFFNIRLFLLLFFCEWLLKLHQFGGKKSNG